ncbi:MAG: sigma-70 family RNA polymerase sigma factor [Ilumatobacteraceae bacterium]|nr:sigma-70 family RNA polymerase sigma factor [Ilumatobacter sp.]MCB0984122.1 sigma-70 family RNA polymerase sigma factor [Ilumatobacter sp.]
MQMTDPTVPVTTSFDDLYRTEYPGLIGVAIALTGTIEDGEDAVQGTMLKAFVNWGRVGSLERPGGWCHRVLVNACRSLFRRRRTASRWLAERRRVEPSADGPSPDVLVFWAAVRQLPERPRQVVALHYAGDLAVEEIARILTVPEGTVRSDLTRARAALRAELEDWR